MKDILTAPFVKEMCDTTANMYRLGWDERNGGNISYMLDEEEVAQYLDINHVLREIPTGFKADALIGRIFIVTGTGKYFKNVKTDPENNLGIIRIAEDGTTAQKKELINMKEIPLQSFLLGIFHYSVCSVDNVVGAETFDFWCPSAGGAKRTYKGDIGADWPVDIKLRYIQLEDCDIAENDANGSPEDVIVEADCEDPHQNKEKSKQQMVFNFNVTGNNNSFIQHVDSITNNYYGGQKKDGE